MVDAALWFFMAGRSIAMLVLYLQTRNRMRLIGFFCRILYKENDQNLQYFCYKFCSPPHYQTTCGLRKHCLDLWGLYQLHTKNFRTSLDIFSSTNQWLVLFSVPLNELMTICIIPHFQILSKIQNVLFGWFHLM